MNERKIQQPKIQWEGWQWRPDRRWLQKTCGLQELPGRLWEGKESIPKALAAICKAAPTAFAADSQPSAGSVVSALVDAAGRKKVSLFAPNAVNDSTDSSVRLANALQYFQTSWCRGM